MNRISPTTASSGFCKLCMALILFSGTDIAIANGDQQSLKQNKNPVIRICYEEQFYPPYSYPPARNSHQATHKPGLLIELVTLAAEASGLQPEFVTLPWKRCIRQLKHGLVDGIFAAIWQKERDKWGLFPKQLNRPDQSKSLWTGRYSIYTYNDSQLTWDGTRFGNVRHGLSAPLGYVTEKKLRQLNVFSNQAYSPQEGLKIVTLKRLDGYVVDEAIFETQFRSDRQLGQLRKLPVPFIEADWYLPLSFQWVEKNPELSERFWSSLGKVRQDQGKRLYNSYIPH
ncbi:ABC transporter substrate-binding protein [Motiliproteus sp. MSK22-1]|uniref:substrate-binding periplasmic protein n=1 Tax=Motiliproteus sp. MSK22-1 TaxID=1897630 RepID=UPI0009780990|nr:transporter substrate-binding domain-containing protein [Motiliproteus sp. MSK22-1]OMH38838.1 hypothetical protein BGP75_00210 [Motiliproteus sp. MSK22-1]